MQTDRLLATVLRLYQDVHDDARTDQIYSSTLTLLTHLSNPLNLTLLASHFLSAPAIWRRPADSLRACARVISVYNTAAIHVRRNELENTSARRRGPPVPPVGGGLGSEAWTRAVVKGADERSSRWRHLLVLTGILVGMESNDRRSLSGSMRHTLESAVVTAANLALEARLTEKGGPSAEAAVALALTYAFPLLSDGAKAQLNCDDLLSVAVRALAGDACFQSGVFLGAMDADIRRLGQRLDLPQASPSFLYFSDLNSRPLLDAAGPLSKVICYAVEHARDAQHVMEAQDELLAFSGALQGHWQVNKLSGVDVGEEAMSLTPATLQTTWPAVWQVLKKILFATVAILQTVVSRSLLDPRLGGAGIASKTASKTLHTLRNIYFISSRGNDSFQVYTFTYMASIDILARDPEASTSFLRETQPPNTGSIPADPLHRTLDLFYLNTAEHLPLSLSSEACESLIVQPATVYLSHSGPLSPRMVELFEAAHSAILSVLSCPHNAPITIQLAPFYAETLLSSFPARISPRQFRLAFRTLVQILSPPFPISATHPDLAETLLEMVRFRVPTAGAAPLPPGPDATASHSDPSGKAAAGGPSAPASEQSALALTLVDALPFLPLGIVEDWMTLAAGAVNEVADPALREDARRRFWEVLASGEMDVERAAVGVAWWGTKGGREMVLFGRAPARGDQLLMSGAILDETGMSRL